MARAARTYGDSCGIARSLDAVGERWALLVVRELLLGPKRYSDLQAGLRTISPDVLAQRLRELEAAGIVARRTLPPPAASRVYELTDRGYALEPVLLALGRWGAARPLPSSPPPLSPDAAMVSLPTLFADDGRGPLQVELRLPAPFTAEVAGGELRLRPGGAEGADAVIEADPGRLAAVLWHGGSPRDLVVHGSRRAANRFVKLFPLPAA